MKRYARLRLGFLKHTNLMRIFKLIRLLSSKNAACPRTGLLFIDITTVYDGLIRTRHVQLLFSHPITTPYLSLFLPISNTIAVSPLTITSPLNLRTLISTTVGTSFCIS